MNRGSTFRVSLGILFVAAFAVFGIARADPANLSQIRWILGTSDLSRTVTPSILGSSESNKKLDSLAVTATKQLDFGNSNWNTADPSWGLVYSRVRADLAPGFPEAEAKAEAEAPSRTRSFETDIAEHLTQADVNALFAYYSSPEGRLYRSFIDRIDPIMVLGIATLWSGDRLRPIAPLPLEERNHYFRLLQLSHTMQLILVKAEDDKASHREVSGSGIILGMFMELAIDKGQQELTGLYHEYLPSLVSFENFSKSATAHRFFLAMCKAQQEIAKSPDAFFDFISATTAKHKAEWDALIKRQ